MALGEELVGVVALPLVLLPILMLLSLLLLKIQAVLLRYFGVVDDGVVAVVAGVIVADHAPDAATLPPAHPSRHLPNLLALVAVAPPPSPPRVTAPLPLRHLKSGDTCCSSFLS